MSTTLITMVELSKLKREAQENYDASKGDEVLKTFQERIDKGNRYLASLKDMDPVPIEKVEAAFERLKGIQAERLEFQRKYQLPRAAYGLAYELASQSTTMGLIRTVPGEPSGLHSALQIRLEDAGIELLLDLSYDGVPF
jgi:hypothetical protein